MTFVVGPCKVVEDIEVMTSVVLDVVVPSCEVDDSLVVKLVVDNFVDGSNEVPLCVVIGMSVLPCSIDVDGFVDAILSVLKSFKVVGDTSVVTSVVTASVVVSTDVDDSTEVKLFVNGCVDVISEDSLCVVSAISVLID